MDQQYNGWTNYETWNVALWMDNDAGSYGYWQEQAEEAVKHNDGNKDDAASDLAQLLKDEHQEAMPNLDGTFSDLLQAALDSVNWYEIAEHLVADVEVEDDEAAAA